MKCTIAGCEIPARGEPLKSGLFGNGFSVCGEHRKPVAEFLCEIQREYETERIKIHRAATRKMVDGLDGLGDHEAELALASHEE